jgi:hypothetical protein
MISISGTLMQSNQLFFVSYSRQTLYFTESLVLALQKAGVNLWFDLQQLKPGCNWSAEIQDGLKTCDGIILVVSQAAMRSPYVALEWEDALNSGKPIHLVFFESVKFDPIAAQITNPDGSTSQREILPAQLLDKATSIIDARADFKGAVKRLLQSLQGIECPRDSIPSPNRLRIPTRLPIAVGFIGLSMAVLTLTMAFTTVFNFLSYLPLLIWGAIATGWLGLQTLSFIRRDSYREPRYALYGGIVYSLLFMKWLLPLALIAIVVMHVAPDIRRRTPTGQAFRMYFGEQELVTKRYDRGYDGLDNLAIRVGKLPSIIKSIVSVGGVFAFFCNLSFVGTLLGEDIRTALSPDELRNYTITAGVSFVVMLAWLFFLYLRWHFGRLKKQGYGTAEKTGITYQVIYDEEHDSIMADDINAAMLRAGHHTSPSGEPEDFVIVLLTEHFNALVEVDKAMQHKQKMIFVLGTALTDAASKRFAKYTSYQWVDFRLQQTIRLQAMAEDLLPEASSQQISHSFGTHLEPASFGKRMLPTRVNQYLFAQFVVLNINLLNVLIRILNPSSVALAPNVPTWLLTFDNVWLIMSIVVALWITNKAILREIGIRNIVLINMALSFLPQIIGFLYGLTLPLPADIVRDTNILTQYVIFNLVVMVLTYFLTVRILKGVFGSWLTIFTSFPTFPDVRRDWDLWKRNVLSFAVITLLTISILAPDSTGNPQISSALRSAPGVLNNFVADWVESIV